MKASNYNFFYKYDDASYLAYNSRSNSLAILDKDEYTQYINFENKGEDIKDKKLIENLQHGYFLIDDDVDELKILRFKMYKDRLNEKSLSLTIAPTSNCNFRCVYCYEKNSIRTRDMTPEIEDAILSFIEKFKDKIDSLTIAWYGGEPLLRFDIVERLSRKIIKICKENNIMYFSSIVTNGYLLTPEIAKKLNEYKIDKIQITLDGIKEIHDKRRILSNRQGTFDKIISNLIECKNILKSVSLRINIDNSNFDSVNQLYDYFKENDLLDFIVPYLGHVKCTNECYNNETCISLEKFSEESYNFKIYSDRELGAYYPFLLTNVCGADSLYSFVIDSDGKLYKCWDEIGIESRQVGDILQDININMLNINYMTVDATLNEECSKCKYLPICMGGCPIKFGEKDNCVHFRYHLDRYLKRAADLIAQRNF